MRPRALPVLFALTLLCGFLLACGGTDKRTTASVSSSAPSGADAILRFGQAADPVDRRAIAALVERYHADEVAEDGRSACALIYPVLATAIALSEGQNNAVLLGSKTCPEAMSRLFRYLHRQLLAPQRVIDVRVNGDNADVELAISNQPLGLMEVKRYANNWMIDRMTSGVLP